MTQTPASFVAAMIQMRSGVDPVKNTDFAVKTIRAAAEAGLRGAVSDREADDLIREAGTFLAVVARVLGVAHQPTLEPVFDSEGPQLVLVSTAS